MRILDLTESLNDPLNYTWKQKTSSEWYGEFVAEDNSNVVFSATQLGEGWEISWLRDNISSRIKTDPSVARRILATVNAMIADFITAERPETIFVALTSPDQTKMNIYHRILNKLGYTGYLEDDEEVLEQYDLDTDYTWYIFN